VVASAAAIPATSRLVTSGSPGAAHDPLFDRIEAYAPLNEDRPMNGEFPAMHFAEDRR
jgi:hypothetical protein